MTQGIDGHNQIIAETITEDEIAAANKDGLAGVPSMRTIGTGATQAAAGNHDHAAVYIPLSYIDIDGTLAANSDLKIATQKAVKTYADARIAANDALVYKGAIDASANPNYPAADAGHAYKISVAGKIGGASGVNVEVGDLILCIVDGSASGNQATVGANWDVIQVNLDGAVIGPTSAVSGNFASFSGAGGKLIQDSGVSPSSFQPIDSDLTAFAALTPADDDIPQRKAGAWTNRTLAQFLTDLTAGIRSIAKVMTEDITFTGLIDEFINSNTYDYAPTGHATASIFRLRPTNDYSLGGIAGGTPGRVIFLYNAGTGSDLLTITSEDSGSIAANQFYLYNGESVILPPGVGYPFIYDGVSSQWRPLGKTSVYYNEVSTIVISQGDLVYAQIADDLRNFLPNGDLLVWQRGVTFASAPTNTRIADMYKYQKSGLMVHDVSQDTDVPTIAQSGWKSPFSLKLDCTTIDATIGAGDFVGIQHAIEGYEYAFLKDQTVTLSFWVKATKTGIYCISFRNNGFDRSYIKEYTVFNSATWEKKTITLSLNQSGGTESYSHTFGLGLFWTVAAGSTFQTTQGAWQNGNFLATSNQVNGVDNVANDFRICKIKLERCDFATPFIHKSFAEELQFAKRHFYKTFEYAVTPAAGLGIAGYVRFNAMAAGAVAQRSPTILHPVQMRIAPGITFYNPATGGSAQVRDFTASADCTSTGTGIVNENILTINTTGAAGTTLNGVLLVCYTAEAGF